MQIQVQCSKNYFKTFLSQEAEASRNNMEKEPQKPRQKFEQTYVFIYTKYLQIIFIWDDILF